MVERTNLDTLLQQHEDLHLNFVVLEEACEYAHHFRTWAQTYCEPAIKSGDLVQINQAKLRLLDRYFEWRAAVPKAHRNRIGMHGHSCIFHVFERTYQALKLAELSISGPLLYIPLPAPAPVYKVTHYDGIPIGDPIAEDEEDEDEAA